MTEQRKLSAILVADVVGYSLRMGRDEIGTLTRLKAHRSERLLPALERHGGRVVKLTGDGLLAEFGSAVAAATAAIEFQQAMQDANADTAEDTRIVFRVGIHLGDVIVDDGDLYGDGVNVASRLEGQALPGGIVLSETLQREVAGKLDARFDDLGILELKHIERPVRGFSVAWQPEAWRRQTARSADSSSDTTGSPPTIAVLPFDVLSDDPKLRFAVDALTDDIIALLARMPGFFVVARSSSAHFAGKDRSAAHAARELGVRYIVEGSMRPTADGVRVSAQLIEAASARVLWSDRFDSHTSGGVDVQDDIARGIISHIEPELTRAEIAVIRRLRPDNVDAWGHFRQAQGATALEGWTRASLEKARDHLRQALAIDPSFSLAHAYLALVTALGLKTGVLQESEPLWQEALKAAEQGVEIDPESSEVLGFCGCALADMGEVARGLEVLQQAIDTNPCNAQAHVALGAASALGRDADLERAIAQIQYGMRLSPIDRRLGFWGWALSLMLLRAGRTQDALTEARAASRRDPKLFLSRIVEALALLNLAQMDAAKAALAAARRLRPDLTPQEVGRAHGRRAQSALEAIWA